MKQRVFIAVIFALMLFAVSAWAQGQSGATIAASKTLDICVNTDGSWRYSGEVSLWNTGATDATGLIVQDCLQYKAAGPKQDFMNQVCLANVATQSAIPAYTLEGNAIAFAYSFDSFMSPLLLTGSIRNSAQVYIDNHSGRMTTGPNPKFTWTGIPGACATTCGCTYTQGYWDRKPGVTWPASKDRNGLFFNSGLTYQQIMSEPDGGNAYIKLAHQYIAAVLNVANGACQPASITPYIDQATGFFSGFAGWHCSSKDCGTQVTWARILDDYNNGVNAYATNPGHCSSE